MKRARLNLKKLIAACSLGAVFMLSGLFFVGCGENPASKITLTADKSQITLYSGESEDVTFTIGNYDNSIDASLNFSLIDSTVSPNESEHVSLEQVSQNGAVTVVRLTGKSGGQTTLIASTKEGNKSAAVQINVKQFSSSITLKPDAKLFVSKQTEFRPSAELFNFEESATERNLVFYRASIKEEASEDNKFVSASLGWSQEKGNVLTFTRPDGSTFEESFVQEGAEIVFMTQYENPKTGKTHEIFTYFNVLSGFQTENAIKLTSDEEGLKVLERLTIVANDEGERRNVEFFAQIPYSEADFIRFETIAENSNAISVQKELVSVDKNLGLQKFKFSVVSSQVMAQTTNLQFKVYYVVGDQNFSTSLDSSISQTLNLPIEIKVAPSRIVINENEEASAENRYNFYNFYDGDYGWKALNINVYRTDSSYDYVQMTFDSDVVVKYKNALCSSPLQIDDISQPVYVRGDTNSPAMSESDDYKSIRFEVKSDYILAGSEKTYEVFYRILTGAQRLEFDNPNSSFEYRPNQEGTGIFVSSSSRYEIFEHLVVDQDFDFATVTYFEGDISAARATFEGKRGKTLQLRIVPTKPGIVSFKVQLDNGVEKVITLRVVDTFDNLSVNLSTTGNDGVQSSEKTGQIEEGGETFADSMRVVVQNSANGENVSYSKRARVILSSSHGHSIFDHVRYISSNGALVQISEDGAGAYILQTNIFGEGDIDFVVSGKVVEDFQQKTIERRVRVNLTSFVPLSELEILKAGTTELANSVSLYVGNLVSDPSKQTVSFDCKTAPASAFGFYSPHINSMSNSTFRREYLYWTLDGTSAFLASSGELADVMKDGMLYKIGTTNDDYFGIFDTSSMTFTVNKDYTSTFSFTLFAAVRQYGISRYFPVTINGLSYDNVQHIYSNFSSDRKITFTTGGETFDIGVFLNPSTATDKNITARFVSSNKNSEDPVLISNDNISCSKVSDGVWIVSVSLNDEVLSSKILDTLSGTLEIIPNAWLIDGRIVSGYETAILRVEVGFQNGTEENRYVIKSASDLIAIGASEASMNAHYELSTSIDLSAYSGSLPIGEGIIFSGSIKGLNNAEITGISLENGASGLFSQVSGKISGITFKGRINTSFGANSNVGLVASQLLSSAILDDIRVEIAESTANISSGNIGGVVGQNLGTISNVNVIFTGKLTVISDAEVNAGGVAGISIGNISGFDTENATQKYGLSAYTAYALIEVVSKEGNFVGKAAAIAARVTGASITNILAGGEIRAQTAAGIVCDFSMNGSAEFRNITSRVFVRGKNIGLITQNISSINGVGMGNFKVQAVDSAERYGIDVSMGIIYAEEAKKNFKEPQIAFGSGETFTDVQLSSYVARQALEIGEGGLGIEAAIGPETYFGDFIEYNPESQIILAAANFEKLQTSFSVRANEKNGFHELKAQGLAEGEVAPKVIYMYYFEAAGYFDETGNLVTSNLYNAQNLLNSLNRVTTNSPLYPFEIVGEDVSISSSSPLLEIDALGNITVSGAGLAEIEIKSLLNERQNEKIYLYIINYFNVDSYLAKEGAQPEENGIFTLDGITLGAQTSFKVYSHSGVDILISPSYKASFENIEVSKNGQTNLENVSISRDGYVNIGGQVILLKKNTSVSAEVENILAYGNYELLKDGISFSKKPDAASAGASMQDVINLKANLSYNVAGKRYSLDITTLEKVTIDYYEGASAIFNTKDNYPLSSSMDVFDVFEVLSDDPKDMLLYRIVDDEGRDIATYKEDGSKEDSLFHVNLDKNANRLVWDAQICVDKTSLAFQNRLNSNIYKTYYLELFTSSQREVLKSIPIELTRENVDVISLSNYSKITGHLDEGDSQVIIPGQNGYMSITLSPVDADFEYVQITNNALNSLQGASEASFVFGYLQTTSNGEGLEFVQLPGAEAVQGGIRISRDAIEKAFSGIDKPFNGQFYLRYIFSNISIIDGQHVAVDVRVHQSTGDKVQTFEFPLFKKDAVSIRLAAGEDKREVARGVEYELSISALGYTDFDISVSHPQLASIIEREGKTYLSVTNNVASVGENFSLGLIAEKINEFGEPVQAEDYIELNILDFVINYSYSEGDRSDILAYSNNNTITSAIGERKNLKFAFDGMIEYNSENTEVANSVSTFLNELTESATWTLYTDLNINNEVGVQTKPHPITTESGTRSIISENTSIKTKYLTTAGLSFVPMLSNIPEDRHFFITTEVFYKIENGKYQVSKSENDQGRKQVATEVDIYSYLRGSEVSPNPIASYDDFLNMDASGYYILTSDIVVPADKFEPLNKAIAYLDGNGYKFIFKDATYNIANNSSAGLFGTISQNTVLKNITIQVGEQSDNGENISPSVTFKSAAASSLSFGLVAGTNNGTITNANVLCGEQTRMYLDFESIPNTNNYYFGGVVGTNGGYITNSLSSIKATSLINMGGLVGQNQRVIASSAFSGGHLTCLSSYNTVFGMGGLVAVNSESAKILTSFSSGIVDKEKPYSDSELSALNSSVPVGGFVFKNEGQIVDCYSNIPVSTTSNSAGFAFVNNGQIERAFSTSKIMNDYRDVNYYFAGNGEGTFADCFYIKGDNINIALSKLEHAGVQKLEYSDSKNEFSELEKHFANFAYSKTPNYNSVWFFTGEGEPGNSYFVGKTFSGGRLELVSSNIRARSRKNWVGTITVDGVVLNQYETDKIIGAEDGSAENPHIIYSAETMESYLANPTNITEANARIVTDIDYSGQISNYTKLYNVDFRGNLEGNGMTVHGIQISSQASLDSAGLFGRVSGKDSNNRASIMNLTLIPRQVLFTNAKIVGALAGSVENANIYNVSVFGSTAGMEVAPGEELVIVSGKNIVGGVIGRASANYDVKNINSIIGAFATKIPQLLEQEATDLDLVSYAGGVVGMLAGQGRVTNVETPIGAINVIGAKAGLMFGGTSLGTVAQNIKLTMNEEMKVKAHVYGGLIVGEHLGNLNGAYVYSQQQNGQPFSLEMYVPKSVGGIAGIMRGRASISSALMSQGFTIANQPNASLEVNTVEYVGGIVGLVEGAENKIEQAIVRANIEARGIVGGAVGQVAKNGKLNISQLAIKEGTFTLKGQNQNPVIGGMVGKLSEGSSLKITDAYSWADIFVETYTYSTQITANFGAIVGLNDKASASLENIYTTSLYNIIVEDKSSSEKTQQVGRIREASTTGEAKFYKDCKIGDFVLKANETPEDVSDISYEINLTEANNVYNSSIYSYVLPASDDDERLKVLDDDLAKGFTTLKARRYNSKIIVNQNEYGKDVAGLNEWTGLGQDVSPANAFALFKNEDEFFEKFNSSVWTCKNGSFGQLGFEQNLQ